jgi:hypothetical protein
MTYAPLFRANATSVTLTAGTPIDSPVVTDTHVMLDGAVAHVQEVAATPGLALDFLFTGLSFVPDAVVLRVWYDGTNTIRMLLYDYVASAWLDFDIIIPTGNYYIVEAVIPPEDRFVQKGEAQLRIGVAGLGDVGNDLYLDYVALWHRPFPPVRLYT